MFVVSSVSCQWYIIQSAWDQKIRIIYHLPSGISFSRTFFRQPENSGMDNCNNGWLINCGICPLDQWVSCKGASICVGAVGEKTFFKMFPETNMKTEKIGPTFSSYCSLLFCAHVYVKSVPTLLVRFEL